MKETIPLSNNLLHYVIINYKKRKSKVCSSLEQQCHNYASNESPSVPNILFLRSTISERLKSLSSSSEASRMRFASWYASPEHTFFKYGVPQMT